MAETSTGDYPCGYAIVGDIHGQLDLLKRATDIIDPSEHQFVVQDQLDRGPDVRGTMLYSKKIGAIALADNHSWITGNALLFDEVQDYAWLRGWYNYLENNTLESFGLFKTGNPARDAAALKKALEEDGLLEDVLETHLYLEPADDDFIAVHAGLLPIDWQVQKRDLDEYSQLSMRYQVAPAQVFDDDHFTQSSSTTVPSDATDKILVTGHSHLTIPAGQRITDGGRRVRIASNLMARDPLFIYLTKTHEVIEIPQ